MANVTVTCRNFPAPFAVTNGVRIRDITQWAILRAVVTVGAQRFPDVFSLGWRGLLHRFGMGLSSISFLELSRVGWCLSDEYRSLDGSEKGVVTFWYGMALAKIVAEVDLRIRWLAHVDQMRKRGVLTTVSGTDERGDFVGRDSSGRWHVVEAKGRSNSYPDSLIEKAKRQAARVITINDLPPATTSACIASLFTQPISILLDDPPTNDDCNGEQWRINEDEFFKQYYRGIIEYLCKLGPYSKKKVGNAIFVVVPLLPFFRYFIPYSSQQPLHSWRLELGLLESIFQKPEQAPEALKDLPHDDEGKVGDDGIAVFGSFPQWEKD